MTREMSPDSQTSKYWGKDDLGLRFIIMSVCCARVAFYTVAIGYSGAYQIRAKTAK